MCVGVTSIRSDELQNVGENKYWKGNKGFLGVFCSGFKENRWKWDVLFDFGVSSKQNK